MGAHHLVHLTGKGRGSLGPLVAGDRIEERRARAEFLDQGIEGHKERGLLVFPDHHIAVGAQEDGAERVVAVPKLHVGGVGGIADVQRVEHQKSADVTLDQRLGQPPPAVFAHSVQIGRCQARRLPFAERKLRRPDFHPVVVIGGAIAQPVIAGWVDLAAVAVIVGHGMAPLWVSPCPQRQSAAYAAGDRVCRKRGVAAGRRPWSKSALTRKPGPSAVSRLTGKIGVMARRPSCPE